MDVTGYGYAAGDLVSDGEMYEPVTCTACARAHLVNPKTGKLLQEEMGNAAMAMPADGGAA